MASVTREQRWIETKQDIHNKLTMFGRCCLLRCTGFGKTWLMSELTTEYMQVLYVYPSEIIKDTAQTRIEAAHKSEYANLRIANLDERIKTKIKYVTYAYLSTHYGDTSTLQKLCDGVNLIIFDECHLMGGSQCKIACQKIIQYAESKNTSNDKVHIIGATATIERSDNFDVIEEFFGNIVTKTYTLDDAIKDCLMPKPIYCYCTYRALDKNGVPQDIYADLLERADMIGQDRNNPIVEKVLKCRAVEIANIYNMETIIKDVCITHKKADKYMKFICFFSNIKQKDAKKYDVVSWFQQAFPNKIINTLDIDSEDPIHRQNVKALDGFKADSNVIDLIFCVDMLNLGYHVTDLTGIVMYRATKSTIIYVQQLGRALSMGADEPCIIFDVVDNLHRESLFNVRIPQVRGNHIGQAHGVVDYTNNTQNIGVYKKVLCPINVKNLSEKAKVEYKQWMNLPATKRPWLNAVKGLNVISPENIIATGHEATYRELIAKAVVEPQIMMCARFVEAIFNRWCNKRGIKYPCSKEQLNQLYYSKNGFKEEYIKYLHQQVDAMKRDIGEEFPIFDINTFVNQTIDPEFSMESLEVVSNEICGMTVQATLDMLGITA